MTPWGLEILIKMPYDLLVGKKSKMGQTVESTIKRRIYGHGRGWVFTPKHFLGLGSPTAIRFALHTLNKKGVIRRISQGLYDYPGQDELLGTLSPSVDGVAKAIAEKFGCRIQPSGAYAANVIGLSEQVPGRVIFLTDGPSKKVKIKKLEVSFRHTSLRNMHAAGSREALVIQAFKYMRKQYIDQRMLERAKKVLKGSTRKNFEKNIKYAPEWIRVLLIKLMENEL
jgi:hypothetical protein